MDETGTIFLPIFPFLFIALWLTVTILLGFFSGWFALQSRYPDTGEPALVTLRRQSGSMGPGVAMNGILTLSACPSGLRIGIWRLFGLFQRPFLVPWDEITAEPKSFFFVPMARLSLGRPDIGSITVDAGSWQRLSAHSPARARREDRFEPVEKGQLVRALALQWALVSAGMIVLLTAVTSFVPGDEPVPLLVFAFPAIGFGIAQLVRYGRMRF